MSEYQPEDYVQYRLNRGMEMEKYELQTQRQLTPRYKRGAGGLNIKLTKANSAGQKLKEIAKRHLVNKL